MATLTLFGDMCHLGNNVSSWCQRLCVQALGHHIHAVEVAVPTPPGARAVVGSVRGKAGLIYLLVGLIFCFKFSFS